MRTSKKITYKGGPSEPRESIMFAGYEIKSLKHGNTGHVLFSFPSKAHEWENCWTMDLQTAKNGVLKYQQHLIEKEGETPLESTVPNEKLSE
tara:strand:- start:295 stop:570 length:276 start_codon:yes stop_codon:yes gene_type:complete